jgi:hypothetical protein
VVPDEAVWPKLASASIRYNPVNRIIGIPILSPGENQGMHSTVPTNCRQQPVTHFTGAAAGMRIAVRNRMTDSSRNNWNALWITLVLVGTCSTLRAQDPNGANRVIPANSAITTPAYTPMTEGQRFKQYLKDSVNPMSIVSAAASGGIGQWRERPHEWKEGSIPYGYRVGSAFAEHIARESLLFMASSAFHEDNRYVRSAQTGFGGRLGHALGSVFLARTDDGSQRFSYSRIGAIAGAALISRTWQPHSSGHLRNAGINFGTSLGSTMGMQVLHEFWPHR